MYMTSVNWEVFLISLIYIYFFFILYYGFIQRHRCQMVFFNLIMTANAITSLKTEKKNNNFKDHWKTLCLQMTFAANCCKQFGPSLGPTYCRAWSGSKLYNTLMVFLNFCSKELIVKKSSRRQKIMQTYPVGKGFLYLHQDNFLNAYSVIFRQT